MHIRYTRVGDLLQQYGHDGDNHVDCRDYVQRHEHPQPLYEFLAVAPTRRTASPRHVSLRAGACEARNPRIRLPTDSFSVAVALIRIVGIHSFVLFFVCFHLAEESMQYAQNISTPEHLIARVTAILRN